MSCLLCSPQAFVQQVFAAAGVPQHSENVVIDEAELRRHQQLERLYGTTKSAKVVLESTGHWSAPRSLRCADVNTFSLQHFQREVVKGIEGIINANLKHIETS